MSVLCRCHDNRCQGRGCQGDGVVSGADDAAAAAAVGGGANLAAVTRARDALLLVGLPLTSSFGIEYSVDHQDQSC